MFHLLSAPKIESDGAFYFFFFVFPFFGSEKIESEGAFSTFGPKSGKKRPGNECIFMFWSQKRKIGHGRDLGLDLFGASARVLGGPHPK